MDRQIAEKFGDINAGQILRPKAASRESWTSSESGL
jgi:hypothetical protein